MADRGSAFAPDGRLWNVRRQWSPSVRFRVLPERGWRPGGGDGWGDVFDLDDISPAGILLAAVLVLLGVVLLLVVWPVVAMAVEIVIFLVLLLGGIVARVLFRRPWRVVARTKGPPATTLAWDIVGWRASGEVVAEVSNALRIGDGRPEPAGAAAVDLGTEAVSREDGGTATENVGVRVEETTE